MNRYESENTNEKQAMPLLSLVLYRTCSMAIQEQEKKENSPGYRKDKDQQEASCTLHK